MIYGKTRAVVRAVAALATAGAASMVIGVGVGAAESGTGLEHGHAWFDPMVGQINYTGSIYGDDVEIDASGGIVFVRHANTSLVAGNGCTQVTSWEIACGTYSSVMRLDAKLGRGSDRLTSSLGLTGSIEGGTGDDTFTRNDAPPATRASSITFDGGLGKDKADYSILADFDVRVSRDNRPNDGITGRDRDNIKSDVEVIDMPPLN